MVAKGVLGYLAVGLFWDSFGLPNYLFLSALLLWWSCVMYSAGHEVGYEEGRHQPDCPLDGPGPD